MTASLEGARFERMYDAPAELVWELWTTPAGLGEWFAPDGFESRVSALDLRPGGELRYTMTATAPEQVAFLRETGNPLSVEVRKTFTEVAPRARLAYRSLIDFVPGREPYEHLTTVDLEPAGDRTRVVMTLEPLHDETWTQQHRAHRVNELDHLEAAITRRLAAADYHADVTVSAPRAAVFAAVSTVAGLSGWWTTAASGSPEPGGELRFAFRDGAAVMRVEDRTPDLERWTCLGHSGQPEWAGTTVTFRLTELDPAVTRLQFTHAGLRPQLDCYGECSAGWTYLMGSLAAYAETGTGHPVSP
jgi:uncharacterized protein YndB with AHSA1/START domain